MRKSKTIEEIKRSYEDRVEYVGLVQRVRLLPGGYTPLPGGILVFATVFAACFLAYHLAILRFGLVDPGVGIKGCLALAVGLTAGISNFRYMRNSMERGQWDLILDKPNGTLQLPAVGCVNYQPSLIQLEDIDRLMVRTLVHPDPAEGTKGIYRLSVVCHHQFGNPDDPVSREEFTDHALSLIHI